MTHYICAWQNCVHARLLGFTRGFFIVHNVIPRSNSFRVALLPIQGFSAVMSVFKELRKRRLNIVNEFVTMISDHFLRVLRRWNGFDVLGKGTKPSQLMWKAVVCLGGKWMKWMEEESCEQERKGQWGGRNIWGRGAGWEGLDGVGGGRELVTKKFFLTFGRRLLVSKEFDQQHWYFWLIFIICKYHCAFHIAFIEKHSNI